MQTELKDYFFAGRKLTLPLFVATLVSTWYGNVLGVVEIAYRGGIVNWLTQGFFWYFVYVFFALVISKKIHDSKFYSIPDRLEQSYGKTAALIGAVINLIMLSPAAYVLSMGLILHLCLGWDKNLCIVLGTFIPLLYTLKSSFKSVVYIDFIQFILMFVGVALILPFSYFKYGGLNFIQTHVPHTHLEITGAWSSQIIIAWFLIALWTLVDPNFYQRTYSAADNQTARRGILIATIFWFFFDMMTTLIGLYAFAINPNQEANLALLNLANETLPTICKWIFYSGLIATVVSTLDSLCFASGMCFAYDIYLRIKPQTPSKKIIQLSQISMIIITVIAFGIALYFDSLMQIIYFRGSLAVGALLIPLCISYFSKKSFNKAGLWSLIAGLLGLGSSFIIKQFFNIEIEPIFLGLLFSGLVFALQYLNHAYRK